MYLAIGTNHACRIEIDIGALAIRASPTGFINYYTHCSYIPNMDTRLDNRLKSTCGNQVVSVCVTKSPYTTSLTYHT